MAVKQLLDVIDKRATVEILFKAKRKDNGEWVEGYYVYDNVKNKAFICTTRLLYE